METLLEVLMQRDGYSKSEALAEINAWRKDVSEGSNPEEVLFDNGLEPDYVFDLL